MVLLLSSSSQSTSTVCRSRASSFKSVAQRPVARVRVSTDTQTETETSAPNSVPAVDSPTVPAVDFTPNTQAVSAISASSWGSGGHQQQQDLHCASDRVSLTPAVAVVTFLCFLQATGYVEFDTAGEWVCCCSYTL